MPARVLIIEDSPTEALRARLILERAGHPVSLAADGREGLSKAAQEQPDLILIDSVMPRMNGFETCGRLRLDPRTCAIPVAMLATAEELADLPSGLEAIPFVAKPYDPQQLVATVQALAGCNGHQPAQRDLTGEVHRYQLELERARREVDAAHQARGDFLANMSHELRTPLHEIDGLLALLLDTELTPQQRAYLDTAHASTETLTALVGDVLEFTEFEAGELTLDEQPLDVAASIEQVTQRLRSRATEKGLRLSTVVSAHLPKRLRADANRLRQVLTHLIGNAIKFTDQGEVVVMAYGAPSPAGAGELHVAVCDTGSGIPCDKQAVIFEPFRQADPSTTRRYGGLGLGLAVAHHLVRLMGGRLWVESDPAQAQGSVFHFTLPIKPAAPEVSISAAAAPPHPLNILLAEDSPTNQLIAVSNLKKAGHTLTVVDTGRKAVAAFEASEPPFDLVLMDVAMPDMDGLKATRAIREREKVNGGHVPIIAMTAFTTQAYREKCAAAGMDGYVAKPVRVADLGQLVGPLLANGHTPAVSPVDLQTALDVVGDDVDLLRSAVALAVGEVSKHLTQLKDAVARHDVATVEASAHRLIGVMGNLGGRPARDLAQRLETLAEQQCLDGAVGIVHTLEVEIGRVIDFYSAPGWADSLQGQESRHG